MNRTRKHKVARIIMGALSRVDLSPELMERIQGWIVCEEGCGEDDSPMDAILDDMFLSHRRPTLRAQESYLRLCEKLGLPAPCLPTKRPVSLRRKVLYAAAVFVPLAALIGTVWYAHRPVEAPLYATMVEAVKGEDGVITLPDGSIIKPLEGSRVTIAEDFAERRHVSLVGEAFFSVAHDETRPFTVGTEKLTVLVLGTEFHMRSWDDGSEHVVSLVSGSIKIDYGTEEDLTLAPMERLLYDGETGEADVSSFTPEQIDRWRFGRKHLDDTSLEQAFHSVGGFYDKKVFIEGDLPEEAGITIVLTEIETVESTMEAIKLIKDEFEYTIEEGSIYIVGKR